MERFCETMSEEPYNVIWVAVPRDVWIEVTNRVCHRMLQPAKVSSCCVPQNVFIGYGKLMLCATECVHQF